MKKKGLEAFRVLAKKHPKNMVTFLAKLDGKKFLNVDDCKQLATIATSTLDDLEARRLMKEQPRAQQVTKAPQQATPRGPLKQPLPPHASSVQARTRPSTKPTSPKIKIYERIDELTDNDVARFLFPKSPNLQQKYNTLCRQIFDKSEQVRLQALQKLANEHPQEMQELVRSIDNFGNDRFKNPFFDRWFDGKYAEFSKFREFVRDISNRSSFSNPSSYSYTPPQYSAPLIKESELDRLPEFVTSKLSALERNQIIKGEAKCYLDHPFHGWPRWVLEDLSGNLLKIFEIPPQNKEEGPSRWDV